MTAVAWRDLLRLADDFAARAHAEDDCRWEPPATGHDGIMSIAYPTYSERVQRASEALYSVGAVTPAYDWTSGPAQTMPSDGNPLRPADAIRMATAIIRGERFCDGRIGQALEEGMLQSVMASLAAWYRARASNETSD